MKRLSPVAALILSAALLLLVWPAPPVRSQAPAPKSANEVVVEVSYPASGSAAARDRAIAEARAKAVTEYARGKVPPAILKEKEMGLEKVLAKTDQLTGSWRIVDEKEAAGRTKIRIAVELDPAKVDAALKSAGVLPSRPLPTAFVLISCQVAGDPEPSAWEKPKGVAMSPNPCEAAIGEQLKKYGIQPIHPGADLPRPDVTMVLEPKDDLEKREVFHNISVDYGAGVMVVGKGFLEVNDQGQGQATVLVAVADVEQGALIWTDKLEGKSPVKKAEDRDPALAGLCGQAGEQAVLEIFRAWQPRFQPGDERDILVTVTGIPSYPAMKNLERDLAEQAPGAVAVTLSSVGPGEVTYQVRTKADCFALADWLKTMRVEDHRLTVGEVTEDSIQVQVEP